MGKVYNQIIQALFLAAILLLVHDKFPALAVNTCTTLATGCILFGSLSRLLLFTHQSLPECHLSPSIAHIYGQSVFSLQPMANGRVRFTYTGGDLFQMSTCSGQLFAHVRADAGFPQSLEKEVGSD